MRFLWAFFVVYSQVVCASPGFFYTLIDATNPSVHYSGSTSTLTRDSITFSFTGASIQLSFRVVGDGECTISIDGTRVASINNTSPNMVTGGGLDPTPYFNATMSNEGHTLLLSPGPDTQIEFFEAIIGKHPSAGHINVRAIVGGVLGGVFFIACLILIFYFLRRRKRASSRGLPKGDNLEPGAKKEVME